MAFRDRGIGKGIFWAMVQILGEGGFGVGWDGMRRDGDGDGEG